MFKRVFFSLLVTLSATSGAMHADTIQAAVGMSLAPYVIQEQNAGIEISIVRESLAYRQHQLQLRFVKLKQLPALFQHKKVDAALTVNEGFSLNGCLSDVAISYQNYAITLAQSDLLIKHLGDLAGKKIVAFQNAKRYLGAEFSEVVSTAKYSEVERQISQVKRLYMGRDQVVIADKNIFLYYRARVSGVNTQAPIRFHPIFKPSPYRVAFQLQQHCTDFNAGLAQLKRSGRYQQLVEQYSWPAQQ